MKVRLRALVFDSSTIWVVERRTFMFLLFYWWEALAMFNDHAEALAFQERFDE